MSFRLCAELIDYHYMLMFRALIVLLALQLAGCGWLAPYRIDIQQGNFVSQEMVAQLKRGMTKEQVRFVLGTPLVTDVFHADRWDYVYLLDRPGEPRVQRRLAVFFEDDRVTRLDGDVVASARQQEPAQ
jgi:outer membrane protein assembly factor BamE